MLRSGKTDNCAKVCKSAILHASIAKSHKSRYLLASDLATGTHMQSPEVMLAPILANVSQLTNASPVILLAPILAR